MTFLIDNVERILSVISLVSTVSGVLAIGLLITMILLWATQPFQIAPAPKKEEQAPPDPPSDKKPTLVVVRNPDILPMQKFNALMSMGVVSTSGWEGTNHRSNQVFSTDAESAM